MTAQELVQEAFNRLATRSGYDNRSDQVQLALTLSDLIGEKTSGIFEAPTGLGKSLAALIPAIANAIASNKRTVIATYTNVLAEQYWRKDLPLALSLFDDHCETAFLIGRQRYACLVGMDEAMPREVEYLQRNMELGTESEFRRFVPKNDRELNQLWQKVQTPPVCPARACPVYDDCFYYNARKKLEKAKVVITNHSVVIQDALGTDVELEREGMLFAYDYLVIDEAHDFPAAAINGLEFEISSPRLASLVGVATRLENLVDSLAVRAGEGGDWHRATDKFRNEIQKSVVSLGLLSQQVQQSGIVGVSPPEVDEHPAVQQMSAKDQVTHVEAIAEKVRLACELHSHEVSTRLERYRAEVQGPEGRTIYESSRNYISYIRDFAVGAGELSHPTGTSVSYIGLNRSEAILRRDLIDLKETLQPLLWDRVAYACLSATLQIDGDFEHFERTTGVRPLFKEILPSPYDFSTQCALYLPKGDKIPDPTTSRGGDMEQIYYHAIAQELSEIIETLGGRTLALFHSRKEMEGVRQYMKVSDDLPILMQGRGGIATVGEQFKKNTFSSLFALRSFWTGFDAPGETCSCVVLVRIPFEVPVEPSVVARMAYLSQQGLDPFKHHSLPNAKMIMRQGAGRLIRSNNDKGVIALLDPRLRTKRYGEEILANFPQEIRVFDDFVDAAGWVGLG
jgi:ATP-dependent DNA helicase DinG